MIGMVEFDSGSTNIKERNIKCRFTNQNKPIRKEEYFFASFFVKIKV